MSSKSSKGANPKEDDNQASGRVQRPEDRERERDEMLGAILLKLEAIEEKCDDNSRRMDSLDSRIDSLDSRLSIGDMEELAQTQRDVDASVSGEAKPVSSRKDADKRKSVFMREAQQSDDREVRKQVVIHIEPPSAKHIYLDSMDLSSFTKFIIQWFEYEQINGLRLKPVQIISRRIRNLVMFNNHMDDNVFAKLTATEFCELMAKETQVNSKVEFIDTLKHALRFLKPLDWSSVRPNTHELFFQEILKRKSIFMRTFMIMMEANSKYCPPVSGKDFGSAHVFMGLVDEGYNKRILAEIPKVSESNYPNVEKFLETYVEEAGKHYHISKTVKSVPYAGSDFNRKNVEARAKFVQKNIPSGRPQARVNMMRSDSEEDLRSVPKGSDDDYFEDIDDRKPSGDQSEEEYDDFDDQVESMIADEPDVTPEQLRQIMNIEPPSSGTTRGCVAFALYGNCYKGKDCKYAQGHNESIARETRKWMMKKLSQMMSDGPQDQRKIVSRPIHQK